MVGDLDILVPVELEHVAALLVDQQPSLIALGVVLERRHLFRITHRYELAHRPIICEQVKRDLVLGESVVQVEADRLNLGHVECTVAENAPIEGAVGTVCGCRLE